ncbi:MAG: hypothetical protein ABH891_03870 [Candidatus Omnitrophota bacterium]
MRKRSLYFFLVLVLAAAPNAHATMPTFDAINAALQEIQNSILNSSFAQDIMLAVERLNELKTQTLELFRVHAGLDEIFRIVRGDPVREFIDTVRTRVRNVFSGSFSAAPSIEILQTGGTPEDLRASLETITGNIPEGNERPYIPFEEMQVIEAFDLASQIRKGGKDLRDAARQISEQAQDASPKGAGRLQAQGISELMVLTQQSQESIAKMLELQATQIEQVSRREKDAERARLRFIKDSNAYLDGILDPSAGFSHE